MKVFILGGNGFIGRALIAQLEKHGHQSLVLTRGTGIAPGVNTETLRWDGHDLTPHYRRLDECEGVVNLVGETIGKWPWSKQHKQKVINSRVEAGQAISKYYQSSGNHPAVYIQASGVGYYGDRSEKNLDESAANGKDYLADVAAQWEGSTEILDEIPGVRRCIIRTSVVLDRHLGILPLMAMPVKLFVGGPLGNGNQGVSWIHFCDEARAILHLLETPACKGVYNLSAPDPKSNRDFTRTIAKVLGRPFWFPVPALLLKLVLGEMSDLLLTGQFAHPKRLLESGFQFDFADLDKALIDIYKSK